MTPEFWRFFEGVADQLSFRRAGFERIFRHLDSLDHAPVIIETGCVRREESWASDGSSTLLFDRYAQGRPGTGFITIDIESKATDCAKRLCVEAYVITGDSVEQLAEIAGPGMQADLLYLDSFDCDCTNPLPSAHHHLRELNAAMPMITPETLVVVDDCFYRDGLVGGKGTLVAQYAAENGATPLFLDYQCAWTGMQRK